MKKYDLIIVALYAVVLLTTWGIVVFRMGKIVRMQQEVEELNERIRKTDIHTVVMSRTDMVIHVYKDPALENVILEQGLLNVTAGEGMRISRDTLYVEPLAGARYYLNMRVPEHVNIVASDTPNVLIVE